MIFWLSAAAGFLSACFWLYASVSISREAELKRREKIAQKAGSQPDNGGIVILDDTKRYDLIATLRHQARWNKWGAVFAAIALLIQAIGQMKS